jgi:hypothetical protein
MARARKPPPPLRLQGPPRGLQTLLPPSAWDFSELPAVEVDVPRPEDVSVQVATLPGGAGRALRLELSATTPPGSYRGLVRLARDKWPLTIDVAPHPKLVVVSGPMHVTAEPGGEADAELQVANMGNVSCELPAVYAFGLFEVHGLDHSLAVGFTADVAGLDRVGLIADELAASHGGLMRVRVHEGSGQLGPGDARALRVTLHLDPQVRPDCAYFGYWQVHESGCTLPVNVTVTAPEEVR